MAAKQTSSSELGTKGNKGQKTLFLTNEHVYQSDLKTQKSGSG